MANRRMFSRRITNSGRFLKMPTSSQALYFHLGMEADDDGVVEAFNVMRSTGFGEDDLRVLVTKGLVKVLNEDLVAFIMDWREHNLIRADRKIDSIYKNLLLQVVPEANILDSVPRIDTLSSERLITSGTYDGRTTSKIRGDTSKLPSSFAYKIKREFIGKKCPICGDEMLMGGKKQVSIQHNTPIAKGGKHEIENISVICFECNMKSKNIDTGSLNNKEVVEIWEMIGQSNVSPMSAQVRLGKVRLKREDDESTNPYKNVSYLEGVQADKYPEDMGEFIRKYKCTTVDVKITAEKMKNWLTAKGRKYKNYKAELASWLLREFGSREFDGYEHL